MIDAEAFRAYERAGWDQWADGYDRFFSAVSERNIGPLLDAAKVQGGDTVLDAGCGPGNLAAAAASRGASVIGVDLSESMLALARRRYSEIEFRQADAENLPSSDYTFDAVAANLLVPHLPRPEAGITELVRVLKPHAWLAVSMWDAPQRSRLLGIMWEAIAEVGEPPPAGLPAGPSVLKYSDEWELRGLLESSGLAHVDLRRVEFDVDASDTQDIWNAWTQGSVRTRSAVVDQPEDVQRRIHASFERRARAYANEKGLSVPVSFLVSWGRKP